MENLKKRLLAIFCMVAISVCLAVAQTNTIKHVVDRGETLASIAQRYSTTEAKIIELNPDAAQFVYVGMELIIPVSATLQGQTSASVPTYTSNESSQTSVTTVDYPYSEKPWKLALSMTFGFDGKGAYGFTGTLGANYRVTDLFYLGARIGCTTGFSSSGKGIYRKETIAHSIVIPIEAGVRLNISPDGYLALVPYIGIDPYVTLKSTTETGAGKNKVKENYKFKDFGERAKIPGRVGCRFAFGDYFIGGAYSFSFKKNGGHNWEVGFGWGF